MSVTTLAPATEESLNQKLNRLRAGVLGANDGIVSTAAVVVGVAGASSSTDVIAMAGLAAAVGGAISMALGEYVSVSSQSDTEKALIAIEQKRIDDNPHQVEGDLARLLEREGLSPGASAVVAEELAAKDPLAASLQILHGIDPNSVVSPWQAALASFVAFSVGALIPLAAILLPGAYWRVPITFVATLVGLAITGMAAAAMGEAAKLRAAMRTVIGGGLALGATYAVGVLFGAGGF